MGTGQLVHNLSDFCKPLYRCVGSVSLTKYVRSNRTSHTLRCTLHVCRPIRPQVLQTARVHFNPLPASFVQAGPPYSRAPSSPRRGGRGYWRQRHPRRAVFECRRDRMGDVPVELTHFDALPVLHTPCLHTVSYVGLTSSHILPSAIVYVCATYLHLFSALSATHLTFPTFLTLSHLPFSFYFMSRIAFHRLFLPLQ